MTTKDFSDTEEKAKVGEVTNPEQTKEKNFITAETEAEQSRGTNWLAAAKNGMEESYLRQMKARRDWSKQDSAKTDIGKADTVKTTSDTNGQLFVDRLGRIVDARGNPVNVEGTFYDPDGNIINANRPKKKFAQARDPEKTAKSPAVKTKPTATDKQTKPTPIAENDRPADKTRSSESKSHNARRAENLQNKYQDLHRHYLASITLNIILAVIVCAFALLYTWGRIQEDSPDRKIQFQPGPEKATGLGEAAKDTSQKNNKGEASNKTKMPKTVAEKTSADRTSTDETKKRNKNNQAGPEKAKKKTENKTTGKTTPEISEKETTSPTKTESKAVKTKPASEKETDEKADPNKKQTVAENKGKEQQEKAKNAEPKEDAKAKQSKENKQAVEAPEDPEPGQGKQVETKDKKDTKGTKGKQAEQNEEEKKGEKEKEEGQKKLQTKTTDKTNRNASEESKAKDREDNKAKPAMDEEILALIGDRNYPENIQKAIREAGSKYTRYNAPKASIDLPFDDYLPDKDSHEGNFIVAGGEVVKVLDEGFVVAEDYKERDSKHQKLWYIIYQPSSQRPVYLGDIVNFYGIFLGEETDLKNTELKALDELKSKADQEILVVEATTHNLVRRP